MQSSWKTVRVFISSTFRDMHTERDHLVTVVFPELREQLAKYRVHLVDIDLRWGVTREQSDNDLALDLCLQQIEDCRPFFLGLLGERYGYVPKRFNREALSRYGWVQHYTDKSITELEILHGVLRQPRMHDHAFFFFRDPAFNREVPPPKRAEVEAEDAESAHQLERLKQDIRAARLPVPPVENYPCHYRGLRINRRLAAVALDEAERRTLEQIAPGGIVGAAEYSRLSGRLLEVVNKEGVVYLDGLETFGQRVHNQLWQAIQAELQLPEKPPAETAAATDPLAEEADYHERFMESRLRVYIGRESIQQQLLAYANSDDTKPLLVTGPSGTGKSAVLARFVQSLQSESAIPHSALLIPHFVGASPNSTSLRQMLRRFCLIIRKEYEAQFEREKAERLAPFRERLDAITGRDSEPFKKRDEIKIEIRSIEQEYEVPEETSALVSTLQRWLRKVPVNASVVIIIDALNQLDETDNAQSLHWLPWQLPPSVKMLLSCIEEVETEGSRKDAKTQRADEAGTDRRAVRCDSAATDSGWRSAPSLPLRRESVLDSFQHHPHNRVQVEPLTDAERLEIVRAVPSLSAKTLDDAQIALLLENPATRNPLFLLVALEELRGFGSFEQLDQRITQLPRPPEVRPQWPRWLAEARAAVGNDEKKLERLGKIEAALRGAIPAGDTLSAIFQQVIERLEEEFDPTLVRRLLSLLACARIGLSEQELEELVSGKGQVVSGAAPSSSENSQTPTLHHSAPSAHSAADLFPALRQLRPYLQYRGTLVDFYHRNLFKAVRERYLDTNDKLCAAHGCLADYFDAQGYFLESLEDQRARARRLPPTPRPANVRKVEELPWQLLAMAKLNSYSPDSADKKSRITILDRIEQLFITLEFLEAKAEAGMVFELATDFSSVLQLLPSDRSLFQIIALLEEALLRDIRFIAGHARDYPQALFQCLWNSCWWYDCPQAARHYLATYAPEQAEGLRLYQLMEKWHATREKVLADFMWVRSYRPPRVHLGTARRLVIHGGLRVLCVTCLADGRRIVSGSDDGTIRIWNAQNGEELALLRGHEGKVNCVSCLADGRRIVSASGRTVRIWDAQSGEELAVLHGNEGDIAGGSSLITSVSCLPDGRHIVSGSDDGTVRLWNAQSGDTLAFLRGHRGKVNSLSCSPDGRRIASGARDGTVRVWDVQSGEELLLLLSDSYWVEIVIYSPDGRRIVSGSSDGTVRIWDAHSGQGLAGSVTASSPTFSGQGSGFLLGQVNTVNCMSYSPDGQRIASASDDGTIRNWDAQSGALLAVVRAGKYLGHMLSLGFSPDGRRIVSGSECGAVRIWDAQSGKQLALLRGHQQSVTAVSYSPDGRRIVTASDDGTIRIWDAQRWKAMPVLHGDMFLLDHVCHSPKDIGSASGRTLWVWGAQSGQELVVLRGHNGRVLSLSFSPDGRRIVSGSDDETIRIWDTKNGHCIEVLRGYGDVPTIAAGSTVSPFLALMRADGTAVKDAVTGLEIAWYPIMSGKEIVTHPSGRMWACSDRSNYVAIIKLEGGKGEKQRRRWKAARDTGDSRLWWRKAYDQLTVLVRRPFYG